MKEKIIGSKEFIKTKWSGGETIQAYIYPEEGNLDRKDFQFRISLATYTKTKSSFSDYSGFQRFIFPLKGELNLYHKNLYSRELKKYDVEYFDGAWDTNSTNSLDCIDYNYIVNKDSSYLLQIFNNVETIEVKGILTLFSLDDFKIKINSQEKDIPGNCLYVLDTEKNKIQLEILEVNKKIIFTSYIG